MDDHCPHRDVRFCKDERGAIACFDCGWLFGHLHEDGVFVAYNPPYNSPHVYALGQTDRTSL